MNRVILGALVFVAFMGCAGGGSSGGGRGDRSQSGLACNHFRAIAYDASEGLLTDAELREKLKEVYENASIAAPAVRRAAQAMLREATSGGLSGRTVTQMGDACRAEGH